MDARKRTSPDLAESLTKSPNFVINLSIYCGLYSRGTSGLAVTSPSFPSFLWHRRATIQFIYVQRATIIRHYAKVAISSCSAIQFGSDTEDHLPKVVNHNFRMQTNFFCGLFNEHHGFFDRFLPLLCVGVPMKKLDIFVLFSIARFYSSNRFFALFFHDRWSLSDWFYICRIFFIEFVWLTTASAYSTGVLNVKYILELLFRRDVL